MDQRNLLTIGIKLIGIYFISTQVFSLGSEFLLSIVSVIRDPSFAGSLLSHFTGNLVRSVPTILIGILVIVFSKLIASLCSTNKSDKASA